MDNTNSAANSFDLEKIKECELTLLDEFARVCRNNNIHFTLACGTCLGAVRHKGFIPWDDDIDVFVWARDLPRLEQVMQKDIADNFFYQTKESDPDYHMVHPRLRLNGTTALEALNLDYDIHQGVWIDIYPLYEVSPHSLGRVWQKCWALIHSLLAIHRIPTNHGKGGVLAAKLGFVLFDHEWAHNYAKRVISKYNGKNTDIVCSFNSIWTIIKREYPAALFEPIDAQFEGRAMPIPKGYNQYLTIRYGDYMTLPPEAKRHGMHTIIFFDPAHSYLDYKGTKYCCNTN